MTEPLAIECLDEEIASALRTFWSAYTSCSLRVIAHLHDIIDNRPHMGEKNWTGILRCATPKTVADMLDLGVRPQGAFAPTLQKCSQEKSVWDTLLIERIAPHSPLEAAGLTAALDICEKAGSGPCVEAAARFLEIQVSKFTTVIGDEVAKNIHLPQGPDRAVMCILAGLPMEAITSKSREELPFKEYVLSSMASNHAGLALRASCGDLRGFLGCRKGWHTHLQKLADEFNDNMMNGK